MVLFLPLSLRYMGFLPTWVDTVCEGEYLDCPATIWSLGVLLFNLVCRDLPFHNKDDSVYQSLRLALGLSGGEKSSRLDLYRKYLKPVLQNDFF